MNKKITYIIGGILFLLYYLAYRSALSHLIFYHEQHHLFLFSKEYFLQQVHSEGLISYLTDFFIQFFYYPIIGSALLALLLSLVYLLTYHALYLLTGKRDLLHLSILPSLALFFYTMRAEHSLTLLIGSIFLLFFFIVFLLMMQHRGLPLSFMRRMHISNKTLRLILIVLPLPIYVAGGYYYFIRTYNRGERIMLKTEQLVKSGEWEKVLEYTNGYLMTGRSNQLISYFHHLALYHTGQLPYRLLDYPQKQGVKGLYFPWNSDSRESEYGHILYEELGYINEAQRWEFESMVVWGETAPHLINLARYNIVNHRPLVAQRFINKLKQSLFYREAALELESLVNVGKVPGLRNALDGKVDTPARFANVLNIGPELQYLCENDSTNKMAFEYLMSNLLLSNHVVRFVDNLKLMSHFSYTELPRIYEEALYIYKLGVGEEEFSKVGIKISPATEDRFKRYYGLVQSKQWGTLQKEFGNTYWFYLNYISPYGNKVIAN